MPELPEVETIRAQLDEQLAGRRITSFEASWAKSLSGRGIDLAELVGRRIEGASRRGKVLIISLEGGVSLLVHLRMTGQLLIEAAGQDLSGPHSRVTVGLDDGRLVFNDQRKFGRIVAVETSEVGADPLIARMGPEPLDEGFDGSLLLPRLRRHRGLMVKPALLDQSVVAGVGNIYADEILFSAAVHPARRVAGLSKATIWAIAEATTEVLSRGVAAGGSTLRDYVDADGSRGRYLDEALVVGRSGLPCRRCGTPVEKIAVAGRGTHLCPSCQPAPAAWRRRAGAQRPSASSR